LALLLFRLPFNIWPLCCCCASFFFSFFWGIWGFDFLFLAAYAHLLVDRIFFECGDPPFFGTLLPVQVEEPFKEPLVIRFAA